MLKLKQVCLTGSSGFIGNHINHELQKDDIKCFRWNKLKEKELGHSGILIHLAARVHQTQDSSLNTLVEFRQINRDLTVSLAQQALKEGVKKFIFISSVKVIGEKPGAYSIDSRCCPAEPYGISKLEAEQELEGLFSQQTEAQCIILRLPMVYGEKNKGNMLSLLNAASRKFILPLAAAKGERSMVYVKNIASAISRIVQDEKPDRPQMQTYFLSDGLDMTSGQLYSAIYRCMHQKKGIFNLPENLFRVGGKIGSELNKRLKIKVPISAEIVSRLFDEYRFSSKEFCQDYDWSPPFRPEEGINNTVQWFVKDRTSQRN
jgi:nucleoside-diphosphate-sugar epimerase